MRIRCVTTIAAPRTAVFGLSLDTGVHAGSMARFGEQVAGARAPVSLGDGDEVTWRARHLGMMWTMTVRITDYQWPVFFADEQVSGPFTAFRHEHRFHEHHAGGGQDRTEMVDDIRFSVPFGWPGRAGGLIVLRPYLRWLIGHRNRYLKQLAEAAA